MCLTVKRCVGRGATFSIWLLLDVSHSRKIKKIRVKNLVLERLAKCLAAFRERELNRPLKLRGEDLYLNPVHRCTLGGAFNKCCATDCSLQERRHHTWAVSTVDYCIVSGIRQYSEPNQKTFEENCMFCLAFIRLYFFCDMLLNLLVPAWSKKVSSKLPPCANTGE